MSTRTKITGCDTGARSIGVYEEAGRFEASVFDYDAAGLVRSVRVTKHGTKEEAALAAYQAARAPLEAELNKLDRWFNSL